MIGRTHDRASHWAAYALTVLLLGYAAGKVVFALESRLGFPGGPPVSAAEHERYARTVMDVATAQWLAAATGVLGALLVLATTSRVARWLPRTAMLLLLGGLLLGLGAGAVTVIVDGFGGPGPGWSWYHGVVALTVLALMVGTIHSYVQAAKPIAADYGPQPTCDSRSVR